jgi:hypothetical protein
MKKNVGRLDRLVRISFALVFAAMVGIGLYGPAASVVLAVVVVALLVTSALSFCPLYVPLNHNTVEELTEEEQQGRPVA